MTDHIKDINKRRNELIAAMSTRVCTVEEITEVYNCGAGIFIYISEHSFSESYNPLEILQQFTNLLLTQQLIQNIDLASKRIL